jgi:hypothetical protein
MTIISVVVLMKRVISRLKRGVRALAHIERLETTRRDFKLRHYRWPGHLSEYNHKTKPLDAARRLSRCKRNPHKEIDLDSLTAEQARSVLPPYPALLSRPCVLSFTILASDRICVLVSAYVPVLLVNP